MQEKKSIMFVRYKLKIWSLGKTVPDHSVIVLPNFQSQTQIKKFLYSIGSRGKFISTKIYTHCNDPKFSD